MTPLHTSSDKSSADGITSHWFPTVMSSHRGSAPTRFGKGWTFESVRDLAHSFRADALIDVAAVRVTDGVQVIVAWGKAPFTVIDNSSVVTQASLDEVAQTLAQQIMRRGWPARDH